MQCTSLLLLLLGSLALAGTATGEGAPALPTVHTVFGTECTPYFTWQTLGMMYSHKKSGQPGRITRLMSCTKEEYEALSDEDRTIAPTHVAPSFTKHPRTGDQYSAYNKPAAVIDWLAKTQVEEDYILILDADMIMRSPFLPTELGAAPGWGVSAFYGYLKGVNNALALKHVPEVAPRNDTLAGPLGRRGDQVGGFILQHQSDLRRMAPLWLKYSEDVRADPDAWDLSGDAYTKHPGDKPWISEMYGYSFGAAKANVWHKCHHTAMLYPGYDAVELPKVLHYGLLYEVQNTGYSFDKHRHYDFNPLQCPPWQALDASGSKKGGLFPHPPSPTTLKTTGLALLRDLLALEVPITLNEAFCEHLLKTCPNTTQLVVECSHAHRLADELAEAYRTLELPDPCMDMDERCAVWAAAGECEKNINFMADHCRLSCKVCNPRPPKAVDSKATAGRGNDAAGGEAGAGRVEEAVVRKSEEEPRAPAKRAPAIKGATQQQLGLHQTGEGSQLVRQQRLEVAGKGAKGSLEGQEQVQDLEDLKHRCKMHDEWTPRQVKDCLEAAAQGLEYHPGRLSAWQERAAALEREREGEVSGSLGSAPDLTDKEFDPLSKLDVEGRDAVAQALLGERAGRKGGLGALAHRFDKGRALREGAEAVVARSASKLKNVGTVGVLVWVASIIVFFFASPFASICFGGRQRAGRFNPRKLGRID